MCTRPEGTGIGAKDKVSDCGVVIKFVERGWWLAVCNIAFVFGQRLCDGGRDQGT